MKLNVCVHNRGQLSPVVCDRYLHNNERKITTTRSKLDKYAEDDVQNYKDRYY